MIMRKIVISESQFNKLKNQIMENTDYRYSRPVEIDFYYSNVSFKGYEIDGITSNEGVRLNFLIDMEVRSWVLKVFLYMVLMVPIH